MEKSKRYIFWLIWRAFNISSHLIIVWTYISRVVFPILMVHHFLRKNPYKMSIFQRSVTCSFFFWNCTHILTRTQGKKFEDMFLVKIASKGTSLNALLLLMASVFFLHFWCQEVGSFNPTRDKSGHICSLGYDPEPNLDVYAVWAANQLMLGQK